MLINDLKVIYQKNQTYPTHYIRNILKETLQLYTLQYLSQSPYSANLIFKGRACLRTFFALPYLSKSLDFDCLDSTEFDINNLALSIKKHFTSVLKFNCFEIKIGTNYQTLKIEFPVLDLIGLPLTPSDSRKLCVRLNITPVKGNNFTTEPGVKSTRDFSFVVKHYSLPDLMAISMANILTQEKDEDYFDLAWFLENKETPNWQYLQGLTGLTKKKAIKAIKAKISITVYGQSQPEYYAK